MKFGVVMCDPADRVVLQKYVCYSERSAIMRGRKWKRTNPDYVVRVISLMPRDTSDPIVIDLVPLFHDRPR